ncbi:F-box/kelch-repeat protein [Trifolium medium]|uniref:F-box/kelch-repeat protein n=1 Tax=Trifolium medium TaxID=97028 RepID=A0A392MHG7_9FABA|nr:F-box/kelch-repeat protein [Trifolium medium]
MALISEDKRNDAVCSPLKRQLTSSPSLPTLPFDLIPEILSRQPVKLLLQFRCVCKSWNSLISDPKFAKKHLSLSTTTYNLHCLSYFDIYIPIRSYSRDDSVLTNVTTTNISQLGLPLNRNKLFLSKA